MSSEDEQLLIENFVKQLSQRYESLAPEQDEDPRDDSAQAQSADSQSGRARDGHGQTSALKAAQAASDDEGQQEQQEQQQEQQDDSRGRRISKQTENLQSSKKRFQPESSKINAGVNDVRERAQRHKQEQERSSKVDLGAESARERSRRNQLEQEQSSKVNLRANDSGQPAEEQTPELEQDANGKTRAAQGGKSRAKLAPNGKSRAAAPSEDNRRQNDRRRCETLLDIAVDFNEGDAPADANFKSIKCHDLSSTGCAFRTKVKPNFKVCLIRFKTAAAPIYLHATVAHATPVSDEKGSGFIVGCSFSQRQKKKK